MKYDDMGWHTGGEFPENSPEEYGGTHIALFMRWCFTKGWVGAIHKEDEPVDTKRVIDGEMKAIDYFIKYCDGILTDEDF